MIPGLDLGLLKFSLHNMAQQPIIILGIESSCDETSAAVCVDGQVVSNIIATQKVHEQYGGVVPELASRAHMQHIVPVVDAAIKEAGITLQQLTAIAFTQAPGLIGSLLVGSQFAKSMAMGLQVPLIAVHHMQAHVLANFALDEKPTFPFLCLTVSGGHTQIVLCKSPTHMDVLGETIDDAAGEAFDKSAKLLGLPYPGGPLIDKYAALGNPKKFMFPKPQVDGLNFSFSGLKTAILYFLKNAGKSMIFKEQFTATDGEVKAFIDANLHDICASIQARIISILLDKLQKAAESTGIKNICLAGGVSANKGLRSAFVQLGERLGWHTFIPPFSMCTDNAGMIAITGHFKYLEQQLTSINVTASARSVW